MMTMKTYVLLFAMLLTTTFTFAQGGRDAYNPGDKTFQVGVGLGRTGGYYNYNSINYGFGIPVSAALEFGISEYFSVGPYAAYASYSNRYLGNGFRSSIFSVGAKGSFHYLSLINEPLQLGIDESKLDLYLSVYLGLAFNNYNRYYENVSDLDFGTVLGGRYMVNEQLGVFTEIGYGALAVWTVGVSYRFY